MSNSDDFQKTIKYPVSLTGTNLGSGRPTTIKLSPSDHDSGISFYLNNGEYYKTIPVNCHDVSDIVYSTNLLGDKVSVYTIEHLLSSLHAHRIDNIKITVMGDNEIPIFDGSSLYYYNLIYTAGIENQDKYRKYTIVNESVRIEEDNRWIQIDPYDGLVIDITIDFPYKTIGRQNLVYDVFKSDYYNEVAMARTFGFHRTIKTLRKQGFFKGGDITNAIIINDDGSVLNPPLRWPDEFVRHKLLDMIGDIYVNGPIKGYITSYCSGHKLNNKLMRVINERFG